VAVADGRIVAAIIAGGPARRLGGAPKPFLDVGGRTIAERQLELLRATFGRVLAIANEPAPWTALNVPVFPDRVAGAGPLGGIEAALAAATDAEAVVCVAGDLPFLSPALMAALRDRSPEADAVAPRPGGRAEPLCARYARRLLPVVQARLAAGDFAVHGLLAAVTVDWLDDGALASLAPGGRSFVNVNTPDELRRAEELAQRPVEG
jgi:molybdopterin-guanine dinucleotide biosynthesis protein A